MIFVVATNEDRRQRSDKPKQRSPADLDLYGFADMKAGIGQKWLIFCEALQSKTRSVFLNYAFYILHSALFY
jgi:hypothetical protein